MNYQELLKKHSLKVTPQRLAILSLMSESGHIAIEKLYELMKQEFHSISLATLYKNVNAMLKKNLITEVKVTGLKNMYEITKGEHAHLHCRECNSFSDISLEFHTLIDEATQKSHYSIEHTDIILSGVCQTCSTAP